jgi:hypothetical protein
LRNGGSGGHGSGGHGGGGHGDGGAGLEGTPSGPSNKRPRDPGFDPDSGWG